MKTVLDPIKHVIDFNGTKLFTFPSETCLDFILDDLWSNIIRYLPKLFAIGDDKINYPGYSVISTDMLDNNIIMAKFIEYYEQFGGIYTLDNIRNKWLCGEDKIYIMYDKYYLRNDNIIKTNHLMKLIKSNNYFPCGYINDDIDNKVVKTISSNYIPHASQKTDIIRLHVLSNYVF